MLPAGLCFLGNAKDLSRGVPSADFSGVAAGKTIEDAAVRAFLELVERDAVAIWWYTLFQRPLLDLLRLGEPLVASYARWCHQQRRVLRLHDLTNDFGIPIVAAVSHQLDGSGIALGFGAAMGAGVAACHAVGELAQFETNLRFIVARQLGHGFRGMSAYARSLLDWATTATLDHHPFLRGVDPIESPQWKERQISRHVAGCARRDHCAFSQST